MATKEWLTVRRHFTLALVGLAVFAATVAAVIHVALFADGSLNADEVAYLLQAEAITRGELFLEVPQPAEAFQPWFFVEAAPGFVSKYLPLVAGLFALGLLTTGSIVPVLALLAGVLPLLVAALARQAGLDRPLAFAAAGVVSLSPVVLVESALPLSYLPFLVLVTACWLLVLRLGEGRSGPWGAVLLGVLGTAAACARPYDAVLLLVPGLVWAGYRRRARLAPLAGGLVLGALPLGLAVALYNTEATGRPWRLPFGLLEPADAIGFGRRRLVPEYELLSFGPLHGLAGIAVHFVAGLVLWCALGLVLVPAAVAARRGAVGAPRLLLVLVAVHLAGYAVFWGPWNISVNWGGANRVLGPVYALPVLVLVALLGLPVLARWYRSHPRRVRRLVAVGLVIIPVQLGVALWQAAIDAQRTDAVLGAAARARAAGPVLLDVDPPYLGHPVTHLVDGFALSAAFPVPAPGDPLPQLLQLPRPVYGSPTLTYAVTRQERVEAAEMALGVELVGRRGDVLVVERAGRMSACTLVGAGPVVVTPSGYRGCEGAPVPRAWARNRSRRCGDASCLVFGVYQARRSGPLRRLVVRRLPVETSNGTVALLVDGDPVEEAGNGWLRVAPA